MTTTMMKRPIKTILLWMVQETEDDTECIQSNKQRDSLIEQSLSIIWEDETHFLSVLYQLNQYNTLIRKNEVNWN